MNFIKISQIYSKIFEKSTENKKNSYQLLINIAQVLILVDIIEKK